MKIRHLILIVMSGAIFMTSYASAEQVYSVANDKKVYYTEECIKQFENQEGVFINKDPRVALESEGYEPDLACYGQREYQRRIRNAIPKASDDFLTGKITLKEELANRRAAGIANNPNE